jgi:aspartyl/asparaginyl-tRNA synthetase
MLIYNTTNKKSRTSKNKYNIKYFMFCSISKESIVEVEGEIVAVQGMKVESCTQQDVEIRVRQAFLVSAAKPQLPLQVEDAARREDANQVILIFNF